MNDDEHLKLCKYQQASFASQIWDLNPLTYLKDPI